MKSRHLLLNTCLAIVLGLGAGLPADAQTAAKALDSGEVRSAAMDRTWEVRGKNTQYWTWNADGSVCLRLNEKTGNCSDTGKWRFDGKRICYELTWYGEAAKLKARCFGIAETGEGRYAWIVENGELTRAFTILK